jgi:hypothetical protein
LHRHRPQLAPQPRHLGPLIARQWSVRIPLLVDICPLYRARTAVSVSSNPLESCPMLFPAAARPPHGREGRAGVDRLPLSQALMRTDEAP